VSISTPPRSAPRIELIVLTSLIRFTSQAQNLVVMRSALVGDDAKSPG
jgi:hypothetical protein